MRKIFLASESPRRVELLTRSGIPFIKIPRERITEEPPFDSKCPEKYAIELAKSKALSAICEEKGLILGCDTIVVYNGLLMEKPRNPEEAIEFLTMLQDNKHTVFTGLAILDNSTGHIESTFEATDVLFSKLTPEEINAYVDTRESLDKAGAYGIQEKGAFFIKEIHGDYFNVVGLPLFRLTVLLEKFNISRLCVISY
ncbi:septum formation protein Maf [bacterium]|nr:septum formation protein Maf [bacterium]